MGPQCGGLFQPREYEEARTVEDPSHAEDASGVSRSLSRRLVVSSVFLAAVGIVVLGTHARIRGSSGAGVGERAALALSQQAYLEVGAGPRFVEVPLARSAGDELHMSVEMLGFEHKGSYVMGHFVKVNNPAGRLAFATPLGGCGKLEKTSVTARGHLPACRLAVDAGLFDSSTGSCVGNLVVDSHTIQSVPIQESGVNFGIRDGKFAIGYFTQDEVDGFDQLVSGRGWLVRDGQNNLANRPQIVAGNHTEEVKSRTAVGVDERGRLIILQVDGTSSADKSEWGLSLVDFADLLIRHGAVQAVNLNGGGSSAMVQDGVLVNYPSDDRSDCPGGDDYQCERPVSSILCVQELPSTKPVTIA